jgi:hypothetical protein
MLKYVKENELTMNKKRKSQLRKKAIKCGSSLTTEK